MKLLVSVLQDQDERLWLYIESQLLQGKQLESRNVTSNGSVNGIQLPQHPLSHQELINGHKNCEEEEIDDDEETALNEEEIDDDEDTAMVSGRGGKMVPDTLTISQFNPLTSTHMTFTRANDGGQETVNLSIPDTDQVAFPDINIRDEL